MSDPEKNRPIVSATLVIAYMFFLAATLLTGYSSQGAVWTSDQQRSESFATDLDTQIAGHPISLFLKRRTAVLVSGIKVPASQLDDQTVAIEFKL